MERREIDEGTLSQDAIAVVNCVRSSLFTSYGLRRDSKLILYPLSRHDKLIMIEGDKLRYMGPNERSISILLSMSAKKLSSADLRQKPESSPGITTLERSVVSSLIRQENCLLLYQSDEGLDLRTIKFTENTVFICRLNRELNLESFIHLFRNETQNMCRVKSEDEAEKAILLTNIEIDRQRT